jgi:hypothetical protein
MIYFKQEGYFFMKKKTKLFSLSIIVCLIFITLLSSSINAGYYTGGFGSGKLTYGVGNGSTWVAQTAASQWNGVSTKVSYTYSTASNMYGSTASVVTYFNLYSPPTAGALGQMYPYKSWTGTYASLAGPNDRWVKAVAYQYTNSLLNTNEKKIATATHELGHCLSIDHAPPGDTAAVMRQDVKTSYSLSSYDRVSLKRKWGN